VTEAAFEQSYPALTKIAAVHAARAVRRHGLPADARRDLQQDAVLELWRKRVKFDEQRADWLTFSERAIANYLRSRMRSLLATRRGHGLTLPFHEHKYFGATPDPRIELRIDVARILAGVPERDRAVAIALSDLPASDTSRFLGVSRSTVYVAIKRLRERFARAGLQPCGRRKLPTGCGSRCDEDR